METSRLICLISIIIAICFVYIAIIIGTTPVEFDNINITISEKYPVHTYDGMCGKTPCLREDPSKVIDEEGNLYIVENEKDWAKMKINKTYNVKCAYSYTQDGNIIGINY